MSWARIYRVALRALPPDLRRKHGSAMEALFAHEVRQARERGRVRGGLAAARAVWDVVQRGVYERLRSRGGGRWSMDGLGQDVTRSLRSLLKAGHFTTAVVLTLALGIGANSAVFSVVDAVLLQPLPFPNADRVVHLAWDGGTHVQSYLTRGKYQYWHDNVRSFDAVATWRDFHGRVGEASQVSVVTGLRVSREFLGVLGYSLGQGRDFMATEDVSGGAKVAIVSHEIWQSRFGGASDVVGRMLHLNEEPYVVVGVLPESFQFPYVDEPVRVLVPLGLSVDPMDEGENWPTIASLREGVLRQEAQTDVSSLTASFAAEYPDLVYRRDLGMKLATFSELYVGESAKALWILMGVVVLVFLISCANVANLFLARAMQRRGETALRAALGASRGRLARLVLTEAVLVALAAGSLGLLMSRWAVSLLVSLAPSELPRMGTIAVDWRVMLFTYVAALAASIFFGGAAAWAAWPAARGRLSEVLKQSARGASGRGRTREGLLVVQSAISMVLLAGAGLLMVTLFSLARVDAGFDPEGLVAVRFPVRPPEYQSSQDLWDLQQRVREQVQGSAAIASIVGATNLPLERGINFPMTIGGRPGDFEGAVEWRAVTPDYFRTLGVPIVAGRPFEDTDVEKGPPVVIVNEAFVRRYFLDENPIGQRIEIGRIRDEFIDPSLAGLGAEIVGVVGDIREVSLRADPRRTMYVPQAQAPTRISNVLGTMPVFIAQGRPGGGSIERALVEAFRAVDPALPRPEVFPLDDVVTRSLARERFGAVLLSLFAALALALTAVGVYGVLAYTVRQRYREIAIRMALGAGGLQVRQMVLRQGITPVLVGLLLGLAASLGLSRIMVQYLWGVTPTDPATLAAVATILLGVALAASWIPAREAVRLDPVTTLKAE